jgi:hypothetical protein
MAGVDTWTVPEDWTSPSEPPVSKFDNNIRNAFTVVRKVLEADESSQWKHGHANGLYSARPAASQAGRIYVATDVGVFADDGSDWHLIFPFEAKVVYEEDEFFQFDDTATVGRYATGATGTGAVTLGTGSSSAIQIRNGGVGDYCLVAQINKQLPGFTQYPYWFEHRLVVDTTAIHAIFGAIGSMPADAILPNECICFYADTVAKNGNWWALTRSNGGAETNETDTGIPLNGSTYLRFAVEVTAANAIKFYIDETLEATHAPAVMPTGNASFAYKSYSAASSNKDLVVDHRRSWWTRAA